MTFKKDADAVRDTFRVEKVMRRVPAKAAEYGAERIRRNPRAAGGITVTVNAGNLMIITAHCEGQL